MKTIYTWLILSSVMILMLFATTQVLGQTGTAATGEIQLDQLLNEDGTIQLRPGLDGRINAKGWKMALNSDNVPLFVRNEEVPALNKPYALFTDSDNEYWDDRFGINGADSPISAMAYHDGKLYVGGNFSVINGIHANGIASWDGSQWQSLGEGVLFGNNPGTVYAIAVEGTNLYVGGWFNKTGSVEANNIARWDLETESWHTLGTGTNSGVMDIAISGNNLFAGGWFTQAGGITVNRIARWNGSNWFSVGGGLNSDVHSLIISEGKLIAGGWFTRDAANSKDLRRIAEWDGGTWSEVGGGLNSGVFALGESEHGIYVGGGFTEVNLENNPTTANRIAHWDGNDWTALGSGVNSTVMDLTVVGSDLIIGGYFTTAGIHDVNRIARWNGTDWNAMDAGLDHIVLAITPNEDILYVGGNFTSAGSLSTGNIVQWNDTWSPVGINLELNKGVLREVYALAVNENDLYVGGRFGSAGGVLINNIARWDGTNWHPLAEGITVNGQWSNSYVLSIEIHGSDIYVGGWFNQSGATEANNVARWNTETETWHTMGDGTNGNVYTITVAGSNVYAGGSFTEAGGSAANRVARWNGTNWFAVGNGFNGGVQTLAVAGSELYAGGWFSMNANNNTNLRRLAKWDGTSWSEVGGGLNGEVSTIAVQDGTLYIGGWFNQVNVEDGGTPANRIAKWDGTDWSTLGGGLNSGVYNITLKNNDLYAVGEFSTAGIFEANRVAKWDGTQWSALGSGTNSGVYRSVFLGNDFYIGGWFSQAGGKSSGGIAKWSDPLVTSTEDPLAGTVPTRYRLEQNYPNPFNPATTIRFSIPEATHVSLTVFDILGRKITTLVDTRLQAGEYSHVFNAGGLSSGIYVYQLRSANHIETRQFTLLK